jgi:hypothetical protein
VHQFRGSANRLPPWQSVLQNLVGIPMLNYNFMH